MLLFNIVIVVLVILLQYLNMLSITKTIKIKDKFMFLDLVSNEFVNATIKPFKQKILMFNRIFLLASIVIAPFFILFNKSGWLLTLYIIIFLILPFFINQYLINKDIKALKDLNVVNHNQEANITGLGLFYFEDSEQLLYSYGYKRYALNLAKAKGKAILGIIIALTLVILLSVGLYAKPTPKPKEAIKSIINDTELVISYDKQQTKLPLSDVTKITKVDELPVITSKVDGVQDKNVVVGTFNLQGMDNSIVYADKKAKTFLIIQTKGKYYVFSDTNETTVTTIYDKINKKIQKPKEEKKATKKTTKKAVKKK